VQVVIFGRADGRVGSVQPGARRFVPYLFVTLRFLKLLGLGIWG